MKAVSTEYKDGEGKVERRKRTDSDRVGKEGLSAKSWGEAAFTAPLTESNTW